MKLFTCVPLALTMLILLTSPSLADKSKQRFVYPFMVGALGYDVTCSDKRTGTRTDNYTCTVYRQVLVQTRGSRTRLAEKTTKCEVRVFQSQHRADNYNHGDRLLVETRVCQRYTPGIREKLNAHAPVDPRTTDQYGNSIVWYRVTNATGNRKLFRHPPSDLQLTSRIYSYYECEAELDPESNVVKPTNCHKLN